MDASEKTNDHLVLSKPNHHPTKIDVLSKTLIQIILAAKWLVWHSSTFPKQQRRPLPSFLSVSSSMTVLYLFILFIPIYTVCYSKACSIFLFACLPLKHLYNSELQLENFLCQARLRIRQWLRLRIRQWLRLRPSNCLRLRELRRSSSRLKDQPLTEKTFYIAEETLFIYLLNKVAIVTISRC